MTETKKAVIQEKKLGVRQALLALLQGLSEAEWETAVYSEGIIWSVSDVLRHLVNAEKGMTGLIAQFQQGKNPVPADFDRDRFNQRAIEKSKEKSPAELIAELAENQATFLALLAGLAEGDWTKNGRHASLKILTIEQICHLIPDHEQSHIEDIRATLKKQG